MISTRKIRLLNQWNTAAKNPADFRARDKWINEMNKSLDCCKTAIPAKCEFVSVGVVSGQYHKNDLSDILRGACSKKQKETETTMDTRTEAQQAKDYLIQSLDQAMWQKEGNEMPVAYGLVQKMPKTVGELKAAVANGWLRIDTGERADEKRIYSWMDYLVFEDPKVKKDEEGYNAAVKQMRQAGSAVKDQIVVMGPEKGLEALNAFKAQTF